MFADRWRRVERDRRRRTYAMRALRTSWRVARYTRRWRGRRYGRQGFTREVLNSPFGPFGPFGPFSPFSPFRRRGAWKYVVAATVARAAINRAADRFAEGPRRPEPVRPGPRSWRRFRPGTGRDRDEVRGDATATRTDESEQSTKKEGWMPRFGRGFPGLEGTERRFDRGDVKYVLMDLLREGPRHGYDMIKELERRSGGLYTPSAGSVYPTLQMLEDQGLVASTTVDGKRTYRLTDSGYAFIEERADRTDDARGRAWADPDHVRDDFRSLGREAGELARSLRNSVRTHAPDTHQLNEIRDVIGDARKRIEAILAERREKAGDDGTDKPTVV